MSFRDPSALWWLLLVPAFAGIAVLAWWRRQRALRRFASREDALASLGVGQSAAGLRATQTVLVLLALALLVVAHAGPRYGSRTRVLRRRGVDVVLAVDFSKSMLARDVPPSRIDRAKAEIIRFLDELGGDRVGLVAFAGETMEFPMTDDYAAAALFLRDLGPYDMPVGGTAIGRALVASKRLLERSRPGAEGANDPDTPTGTAPERVVILLTDGEDHEGDPVEAAQDLANAGIRVFPVGIGSPEGEPIPTYSDDGTWTGYLRDDDGQVVKTALTPAAEAVLGEVATLTEGTYVRAEAGGVGMGQVRAAMRTMRQEERRSRRVTVHEDRAALALLPALLLLLAASLLPDSWTGRRRPRPKPRSGARTAATIVALGITAAAPPPAQAWELFRRANPDVEAGNRSLRASDPTGALSHYDTASVTLPDAPGVQLDRGLALLDAADLEGALDALRIASSPDVDPEIRADAAYDLGLAFFRRGEALSAEAGPAEAKKAFQEAAEAFRTSLRARPGNRDAAWNLELALRRIVDEQERQEQQEQEQQEEEEEQEEQEQPEEQNPQDPQDPQDDERPEPQDQDPGDQEPESRDEPEPGENQDDGASPDEPEPEEAPSPEDPQQPEGGGEADDGSPGDRRRDQDEEQALPRDVESVLDALRQDEESLERARARARRGTRRPPIRDW